MRSNFSEDEEIKKFLTDHASHMPFLFTAYDYDGDSHDQGFPKAFEVEQRIAKAARQNTFNKDDLLSIAIWGNLRNKKTLQKMTWDLKITLYSGDLPARGLQEESENLVSIVKERVPGFGATYSSKLLHFAVPSVFGMLDTWLVRTFGIGDPAYRRYKFLKLKTTNDKTGWVIPTNQPLWPAEYGSWINILNYIADYLNKRSIVCPHPQNYINAGLRKTGIWSPADVETALFSYAYEGRGETIIKMIAT